MAQIRCLCFTATPGADSTTGWHGHGEADVRAIAHRGDWRLSEHGRFWPRNASRGVLFDNIYRWRLWDDAIALSHERFGADQAVHLFDLVDDNTGRLVVRSAHRCGDDVYSAVLTPTTIGFDLDWVIQGPNKNERLYYRYTTRPAFESDIRQQRL